MLFIVGNKVLCMMLTPFNSCVGGHDGCCESVPPENMPLLKMKSTAVEVAQEM